MSESRLQRAVEPAVKAVARRCRDSYFTKSEVVREVLRRADLANAVIEIRRSYLGAGLDQAILSYVDSAAGRALRARDENGIRLYECYPVGQSEYRWRRLRDMRLGDLDRVIDAA